MFVRPAALRRNLPAGVLLAVLGTSAVSGCGSDSTPQAATSPATTRAGAPVSVTDPWAKAAKAGMTGVFGTLVNNSGAPVNVVSASSDAAKMVEIHEVVDDGGKSTMRRKEGGIEIPAKGSHRLEPGGDHIMLMGLKDEVRPGDQITITLTLKDGGTVAFTAVTKEFAGGKENYQPGSGASPSTSASGGMEGMSGELRRLRGPAAGRAGQG